MVERSRGLAVAPGPGPCSPLHLADVVAEARDQRVEISLAGLQGLASLTAGSDQDRLLVGTCDSALQALSDALSLAMASHQQAACMAVGHLVSPGPEHVKAVVDTPRLVSNLLRLVAAEGPVGQEAAVVAATLLLHADVDVADRLVLSWAFVPHIISAVEAFVVVGPSAEVPTLLLLEALAVPLRQVVCPLARPGYTDVLLAAGVCGSLRRVLGTTTSEQVTRLAGHLYYQFAAELQILQPCPSPVPSPPADAEAGPLPLLLDSPDVDLPLPLTPACFHPAETHFEWWAVVGGDCGGEREEEGDDEEEEVVEEEDDDEGEARDVDLFFDEVLAKMQGGYFSSPYALAEDGAAEEVALWPSSPSIGSDASELVGGLPCPSQFTADFVDGGFDPHE